MVIQCDSESQAAHILIKLIKNIEITIYTIILCDQLKQWYLDIPKYNVITVAHNILIFNHGIIAKLNPVIDGICIALSHFSCFLFLRFDDVMSNFEYSSFVFKVFKYFCVHLQTHFEEFSKYGIKWIV